MPIIPDERTSPTDPGALASRLDPHDDLETPHAHD